VARHWITEVVRVGLIVTGCSAFTAGVLVGGLWIGARL
jgi:hypothetical protein